MKEEIIIAGFGGQGVLSMGKILAYGGIMQDQEVSWLPSYGPEMRGGTCNVSVVLSDNKISSPVLSRFDTAIILNQQSMDKFEKQVKPGGLLIYDTNGITRHPERRDITICRLDAAEEAIKMGNAKAYNMVVLGAYLKRGLFNSYLSKWRKHYKVKLDIEEITDFSVLQHEMYNEKGEKLD